MAHIGVTPSPCQGYVLQRLVLTLCWFCFVSFCSYALCVLCFAWTHTSITQIWHLGSLTAANWVSFDFNVCYSSCWGYSLINTLKLKKHKYRHAREKIAHRDGWTRSAKAWHFSTPYNMFQSSDVKLHTYTHDEKEQKIVNRTCWDIGLKEGQGILLAVL